MGRQDWETPWELFDKLDRHFNFTIDAAATPDNTKCDRWLTEYDDALVQDLSGEVIFCNPPYQDVLPWVNKFIEWSKYNMVVALLQDKTDTLWFKKLFSEAYELRFLHGRVSFIGTKTGNMHGAIVACLDWSMAVERQVSIWDWRKDMW